MTQRQLEIIRANAERLVNSGTAFDSIKTSFVYNYELFMRNPKIYPPPAAIAQMELALLHLRAILFPQENSIDHHLEKLILEIEKNLEEEGIQI